MKRKLLLVLVIIMIAATGVIAVAQSHLKEVPMHVTVLAAPVNLWVDEEMTLELTQWYLGSELYEDNFYEYDFWVTGSVEVYFDVIGELPGIFTFEPSSVDLTGTPTHIVMTFNPLYEGQWDAFRLVVDEVQ